MFSPIISQVKETDLDGCHNVESACYTSDGASREKIANRIRLFPEGFFTAKFEGKIIGIINSASTNMDDISDEELKDMVGHDKNGRNIVVFSLAVLPEFQGKGVSKLLMSRFIEASKTLKKKKILLICKTNLIDYYKKYGFLYNGKSDSTHGGFEWHEMFWPIS